jgi:3-phenylpropionate/trans-cinnamate dioxygenase ferredoxin subunit
MKEYLKVATADEIPIGSMKSVAVGNRRIVIYHAEDGFYAMADECSHDYAPISTGHVSDGQIVCPRHGARFDIRTGEVKSPPAVVGIDTYETRVEEGHIFVMLK